MHIYLKNKEWPFESFPKSHAEELPPDLRASSTAGLKDMSLQVSKN